jgi:hypothetical protein
LTVICTKKEAGVAGLQTEERRLSAAAAVVALVDHQTQAARERSGLYSKV